MESLGSSRARRQWGSEETELQLVSTRGQHGTTVGAFPLPARPGLSIPQEVALHFCVALHGLRCSLPSPTLPWAPAVTKVGGAGAPASCLPGKDRSPRIPVVPLELMGKSSRTRLCSHPAADYPTGGRSATSPGSRN